MSLSPDQEVTLKAYILADPTLSGYAAIQDYPAIVIELAKFPVLSFIVWRTSVDQDEIMQNGFDWTRVDNLSVGKARIWEWLFSNGGRIINPAKLNVRNGIDATWTGTAADLAVRAVIYTHCKRPANVIEKLLATGTGTDVSPATMGFEGVVTDTDVQQAMQS